jgi:hypothetical protein
LSVTADSMRAIIGRATLLSKKGAANNKASKAK